MWKHKILNGQRYFLIGSGGGDYQEMQRSRWFSATELNVSMGADDFSSTEWVGWTFAPFRSMLLTVSDGDRLLGALHVARDTAQDPVCLVSFLVVPEDCGMFAFSPEMVEIDQRSPDRVVLSARGRGELDSACERMLCVGSQVLAVLKSKNVSTRLVEGAKYEKKNGAAILDRERMPKSEYYVLEIECEDGDTERTDSGGTGPKKRLHLCRGHWTTYTAERPLFGRLVGTYWIPDHKRGNPELGRVIKDYALSLRGDK